MDSSKVYRHTARAYTGAPEPRTRASYWVMSPRLTRMSAEARLAGRSADGDLLCVASTVTRTFSGGAQAPTTQLTWFEAGKRLNRTNLLIRHGVLR